MEDFLKLALTRESCRNFSEKIVEIEDIKKCVEAARIAPSAYNEQPWHFYIIGENKLEDVSSNLQAFTKKAGGFIVVFEKPASIPVKITNTIKSQDFTKIDIGIAAAHICLMATNMGISNCILGIFNEKKLKENLNIDNKDRIRLVIALGYSETKTKEKRRKELEQISTVLE